MGDVIPVATLVFHQAQPWKIIKYWVSNHNACRRETSLAIKTEAVYKIFNNNCNISFRNWNYSEIDADIHVHLRSTLVMLLLFTWSNQSQNRISFNVLQIAVHVTMFSLISIVIHICMYSLFKGADNASNHQSDQNCKIKIKIYFLYDQIRAKQNQFWSSPNFWTCDYVKFYYYMAFQNSLFRLVDKRFVKTHIRTVVRIFRIWTGVPDVV